MIRVIFSYEGKKDGAPAVAIEAHTEDEAVEQFCRMKKGTGSLRKYAIRDWVFDCYEVGVKEPTPLLTPYTANGREKRYRTAK